MDDSATLPVQRQQLHARRAALVSANAREPRAAAASLLTGTVTVSDSCEFYAVADSISRCREPRSCQDCLATPGCGLTDTGYCRNGSSASDQFSRSPDYHTANFSADSLISNTYSFVFMADSASYCAASDPVCTKCREQFEANAAKRTSLVPTATQFCKGADDCVCIAICEVPRRRALSVMDWYCDQPNTNFYPRPAMSRTMHTMARGDPRAPAVKTTMPPKDTESCQYTKEVDPRGCRRPRTCQSCLDQPACAIRSGQCYDVATAYSWERDFRLASLDANNMSTVASSFPSVNTSYCPVSDPTCTACRHQFRKRNVDDWFDLALNFNTFCVGQDGCVCIEPCESELWSTGVQDWECSRAEGNPSPVGYFLVAAIAWVCAWAISKYGACLRRRRSQDQHRGNRPQQHNLWRNMLDEVPALPVLDLFGWRAYRQELRNRELELLQGGDISRPIGHPVDFERMDPSAPDFDDDDSSAPTAQDPKALASAPMYRSSFLDRDSVSEASTHDTEHTSPSAPDFEEEEAEWEPRESESGRIGLVTRRPWRRD